MIDRGGIDCMSHLDLIKIHGVWYPEGGLLPYFQPLLERIKGAGLAIELSTAGWRKPVNEQYPHEDLIVAAHRLGDSVHAGQRRALAGATRGELRPARGNHRAAGDHGNRLVHEAQAHHDSPDLTAMALNFEANFFTQLEFSTRRAASKSKARSSGALCSRRRSSASRARRRIRFSSSAAAWSRRSRSARTGCSRARSGSWAAAILSATSRCSRASRAWPWCAPASRPN